VAGGSIEREILYLSRKRRRLSRAENGTACTAKLASSSRQDGKIGGVSLNQLVTSLLSERLSLRAVEETIGHILAGSAPSGGQQCAPHLERAFDSEVLSIDADR